MKCPKCGLINPDTAQRCDCGYDFPSGEMKKSYLARSDGGAASMGLVSANSSSMTVSALLFSLKGRIPRSTYWLKFGVPYLEPIRITLPHGRQ
jgi:hypothetical protein